MRCHGCDKGKSPDVKGLYCPECAEGLKRFEETMRDLNNNTRPSPEVLKHNMDVYAQRAARGQPLFEDSEK